MKKKAQHHRYNTLESDDMWFRDPKDMPDEDRAFFEAFVQGIVDEALDLEENGPTLARFRQAFDQAAVPITQEMIDRIATPVEGADPGSKLQAD